MIVKLNKPLDFGGKVLNELDLNFDNLTGADLMAADRAARSENKELGMLSEDDRGYQIVIASRASGVPVDALKRLAYGDFMAMLLLVVNFLTRSVSAAAERVPSQK